MRQTLLIFAIIISGLLLTDSCGFPGPIFTYNVKQLNPVDSTLKSFRKNYFGFDFNFNFKCFKRIDKEYDIKGRLISNEIIKGSDPKHKSIGGYKGWTKTLTTEYDTLGNITRQEFSFDIVSFDPMRIHRSHSKDKYFGNDEIKITISKSNSKKDIDKTTIKYK